MTNLFIARSAEPEDYWRAIVLYGRNVQSYKFALAAALLELKPKAGSLLKLEDLAPSYAKHLARHLSSAPKQGTSRSSQFLDACRSFNQDNDQNRLVSATLKSGFNNVIDAFHVVGSGLLDRPFFLDERKANAGLRITDEFSKILESIQHKNLPHEVEARWNLVETAWELGVASSMLSIHHDPQEGCLFAFTGGSRRKPVTSSRSALNGYQRGRCFYCRCSISIDEPVTADVDHFFPHALKLAGGFEEVDRIWNLVLSCRACNRGEDGKFMSVPSTELVKRLHLRNEYYIGSHHPLRETLIQQTGATEQERRAYINAFLNRASQKLPGKPWEPKLVDREGVQISVNGSRSKVHRLERRQLSKTVQQEGWIWRGRRFGLKKYEGSKGDPMSWDFEFVDFTVGMAIAYINKDPRFGYEVCLTAPNTDAYQMESIRQICTEVPKIIRAFLRSKS